MPKLKNQDAYEVEPKILNKLAARRIRCVLLADSFKRLGKDNKAARVMECGTQVQIAYIEADEEYRLKHANFCRERLCPMCAFHRSKQIFGEVSRVMDGVQKERPELVPIFLTLTVRNSSAAEMDGTLNKVFKGWNQLMANKRMKRLIAGYFRALEITYNEQEDTYHPHIHAILLMPPSYFTTPKDYMSIMDWVKVWRKAAKLDYDPSCRINAIDYKSDKSGAVAEVAKYTLKDTDYLKAGDEKMTDKLVSEFGKAIKGRRLYAYGGIMKEIAKQLDIDAKDNFTPGEIRDKAGNILRKDIDYVLSNYRWNVGLTRYDYEGRI
ncbi:protein rep [Aminobacterium colombiense]|jgi:plasmid rolling circle replication initiator protein Rep|uniref:protein rep n=1 Tax=Aminobacterium colombiense TaxID=81468 RepID=UPI0025956048|nr:protein rep [uncultured Aminobacterium sp.]